MSTRHFIRNCILLLSATTGLATLTNGEGTQAGAHAQTSGQSTTAPISTCDFGAFVAETDPAGLNVRVAPNAKARILGKLPPTFVEPSAGYGVRVEVEVVGARDGWFLIRNAQDNDMLTGQPPRPMFNGEGWVSGSKLTVKSQADVGRARPSAHEPAVLRIGDNETFDSDSVIAAARLVDCNGRWAQLEFSEQRFAASERATLKIEPAARAGLPAGHFRAWVDRLCAIQETSCPGLGAPEAAP